MIKRVIPTVLLLFAVLPCARAQPGTSQAERCVRRYAAHYRVPPELIAALIDVESRWNPRAVSNKGAMGLMQLMPATAQRYGAAHPFDVEENIAAGTRYVTALMWEFHGDMRLVEAAGVEPNAVLKTKGLFDSKMDRVQEVQRIAGL